jgi:hypothetical protein
MDNRPTGAAWRAYMLGENMGRVLDALRAAEDTVPDPVAILADVTDFQGRQVALCLHMSTGVSADAANAQVDADIARIGPDQAPTFLAVISLHDARRMMPNTSPTALESIDNALKLRRPGQHLVITVADGGNM